MRMLTEVIQELTPLPIFPLESASCDSNSCIYCQPLCEGPFQERALSIQYSNYYSNQQIPKFEQNCNSWYVSNSWKFQDNYFQRVDPVAGDLTQVANFDNCKSPRRTGQAQFGQKKVGELEFSSDGRFLAGSNDSSVINLYNTQPILCGDTGGVSYEPMAKHNMPIRVSTFTWSPHDEGLMLVGDAQGALSHIHIYSGHFLGEEQQLHNKRVTNLAYSPHNRSLIASVGADGQLILWDGIDLQNFKSTRPASRNSANDVSFSQQDEFELSVASDDGNIYIYDIRKISTPQEKIQLPQKNPVISVEYMNHNKMASQQSDGQIHIWDMHEYQDLNSNMHAYQNPNLNMHAYRNSPRSLFKSMNGNFSNCCGLSVRTGDNLIARGSDNGLVQIFNLAWTDPVASQPIFQLQYQQQQQQQYYQQQQFYCQPIQQIQQQQQQQNFFMENGIATVSWVQRNENSNLPNLLGVGMQQGQVMVLALTNANI